MNFFKLFQCDRCKKEVATRYKFVAYLRCIESSEMLCHNCLAIRKHEQVQQLSAINNEKEEEQKQTKRYIRLED